MKHRILIFLILCNCAVHAQFNLDSVQARIRHTASPELRALEYGKLAEKYADSIGNKGVQFGKMALQEAQISGDTSALADACFRYGVALQGKSNFKEAIHQYETALSHARSISDYETYIRVLNNLGVCYKLIGDYEEARRYYRKSIQLATRHADHLGIIQARNNMANTLVLQEKYAPALLQYTQAIDLIQETDTGYSELPAIYNNVAYIYHMSLRFGEALKYYHEALRLFREKENYYGISVILGNIADIHMENEACDSALYYLKQAIKTHRHFDHKTSKANLYFSLYQCHLCLNKPQPALHALEKYNSLKDSLDISKLHQVLADISEKYQNEKLLHAQEKHLRLIQKRTQLLIAVSVLVLMSLLLILLIINRYRIKSRANHRLTEKNRIISEKNAEIQESLNYARSLQEHNRGDSSLLKHFPSYFIIDHPKNVVSGDFYFSYSLKNGILIAAGDATGHGIPAGFITNKISHILNKLCHEGIFQTPAAFIQAVYQTYYENTSNYNKESFSISVTYITSSQLIIASTYQKALIFCSNTCYEVGKKGFPFHRPFSMEINDHYLEIRPGKCMLYMFSDGFSDQLSGNLNKKFNYSNFKALLTDVYELKTEEQKDILLQNLKKHQASNSQTDDILILGIKF